MSSSTVVDTYVYTDSEPKRVYWGDDEELSDGAPTVSYYVPGPEHPPSPVEVPYIPKPEHPEYLVAFVEEAPIEDQPLPADASPTVLSPGYMEDFDPDEEEDFEEDHDDYPADGGDGDDEPFDDDNDDDDTNDEDEEPFEDEDENKEEEEHLALADSFAVPVVYLVPSNRDTEAFKTDESAPTSRSPQTKVPFSQIRLRRTRKTIRLEQPMSASMEARISEHAVEPIPPLPVPSPPLPLPSPLTASPTDTGAPLGYREARIRMRALLPSTFLRLRCRLRRELALLLLLQDLRSRRVQPSDEIVKAMMKITPTTLEGVNQKVTELATTLRQDTEEFQRRHILVGHRLVPRTECSYRGSCQDTRGTEMASQKRTTRTSPDTTNTTTTTPITDAQLRALIDQCIAAALAKRDADRSTNGDDGHDSRTCGRRQVSTICKVCNLYSLGKCLDMLELLQLALMYDRMFLEESNVVEKYVGGLPDMIHGSVKASKPKTVQEAIEFATELMDKKITIAEPTLSEEQMFLWKGNLPRLPTESNIVLLSGGDVFDLIGDVDPTDEDGDIEMGDSTGVSASLDGEIFSGGKKCRKSNIGDSDNTGDGGKIVDGAIGACGGI
nr:hypothetical protein [Tanacetum cinerariifolium]